MSIHIIEGLPRHGKTTFAVLLALEWRDYWRRRRRDPRRVVANFPVNVPGVEYVERFQDMQDVSNCILLIDEAYKWFGNNMGKEMDPLIGFFAEHGKEANTMYLIAHKAAMLNVNIRERTAESVWHVRRMMGPTRWEEPSLLEKTVGWWSMCTQFMACDQTAMKTSKPMTTRFICLNKLHGKFDTLTKIGTLNGGGNSTGAGLAATHGKDGRLAVITCAGQVLRKTDYLRRSDLSGWGGHVQWRGEDETDFMDALRGVKAEAPRRLVPVLIWADDGQSYQRVMMDEEEVKAGGRRELRVRDLATKQDPAKGDGDNAHRKTHARPGLGLGDGLGHDGGDRGGEQAPGDGVAVGAPPRSRFRVVKSA